MYVHKNEVLLRKIERQDLPSLYCLKANSWWGTHKTLISNQDDQLKWFESIPTDQIVLVGEIKCKPIGVAVYTSIDFISRKLQISGSIYHDQRNHSIAGFCAGLDFAFEMLNMNRVEAEVLEYHLPAQMLEIKKLGMKIEGKKRKAVYKCGRYYDSLLLGLLRSEWENQERVKKYNGSCNSNFNVELIDKMITKSKSTFAF
jgi:RimJ/RimL family protein N-acetyltransferase